jgi:hypothetical protein
MSQNIFASSNNSSCPVSSCPSLFESLQKVKEQVEYPCFGQKREGRGGKTWLHIDPLFNELCLIIAEMNIKPAESNVRVQGSEMPAAIVQEVYGALTHEHIKHVAAKFKEQGHIIRKKKPYLQTALYNVLFEYDASIINELRSCGLISSN